MTRATAETLSQEEMLKTVILPGDNPEEIAEKFITVKWDAEHSECGEIMFGDQFAGLTSKRECPTRVPFLRRALADLIREVRR